jgi:DNA-binding response OmpR family regulator
VADARITELKGIRVLLITDDEHTLHLVRAVLDLAGAHVVAVTSADAIRAMVTADVDGRELRRAIVELIRG